MRLHYFYRVGFLRLLMDFCWVLSHFDRLTFLKLISFWIILSFLILFRMGLFGAACKLGAQKGPFSLKSVTHIRQWRYLTQLYPTKEDPKNIWIAWHTHWVVLTLAFFLLEISQFWYIEKYRYTLHFDT